MEPPQFNWKKILFPRGCAWKAPEGFEQSVMAFVDSTIPEDPNLKSPTLFTYSLAAICSFWRNVLSSHPEFWTLVVLFVDSKSTPLVDPSLFLQWLQKHHIGYFITRRDKFRPRILPGSIRKASD